MSKPIARFYPFTIPGTVLAGVVFYLLGTGYSRQNPYALFLALSGLFVLAILAALSRIQAYRLSKTQVMWDSSDAMYSGVPGAKQRFSIHHFKTWFFYRVHVRITGVFKAGNDAEYRVLQEKSFTGEGILEIPLSFPFSGTFHGRAVISIQDIFGLVRAGAAQELHRTVSVLPSLLKEALTVIPDATGGEDETQPRKSSDQEKYYMREYMPGDRFRDVNWKATSKIGEMITRISPVTEEETRLILIDFRHFSRDEEEKLEHVAHLEMMKKWCVSFLWQIKQNHPD